MASEVDISNLALAHLGDSATVASITPPDGSAQAEYCQRFYPIARDALLERHDWGFASKRAALALLSVNAASSWAYCYAQPTDLVNTIAVLAFDAKSDTSVGIPSPRGWTDPPLTTGGLYTPQPFVLESAADGTDVLYTDQVDAVLRYVARVTDTTKFSPMFVMCLAASLASMLAGPVLKGDAGASAAARWGMIAFGQDGKSGLFGQAAGSDASQRRSNTRDRQNVAWINGR